MISRRKSDQLDDLSVAVIIPAYNASAFINKAIDSVLAQERPADAIIVIDDSSKDDTADLVRAYSPHVRLLVQQNAGPAAARNLGVRSSRSKYIAFLDADDAWTPDKLSRQMAAIAGDPKCVLCYSGMSMVHEDGRREVHDPPSPRALKTLLRSSNPGISPSCVIVRRDAFEKIGGFSLIQKGCEDWEMWFRLRKLGSFCRVDAPLTDYRVSSGGLSGNADHMFTDFQQMLDGVLLDGLTGVKRAMWRRRILSTQAFHAALTARAAGQHDKDLQYHLQSFLRWPFPFWEPKRVLTFAFTLLGTVKRRLRGRS